MSQLIQFGKGHKSIFPTIYLATPWDAFGDLKVQCCNGSLTINPLILASTSKLLATILKPLMWSEDVGISLPDLKVEELQEFYKCLFTRSSSPSCKTYFRKRMKSLQKICQLLQIDLGFNPEDCSSDSDTHKYLSDVDIHSLSEETLTENFSDQHARLVCLVCYKIFSSSDHNLFKNHIKSHSQKALKRIKITPSSKGDPGCSVKKESEEDPPVWKREQLRCKTCDRAFLDFRGLKSHEKSHMTKDHKCLNCNKQFGSDVKLLNHLAKEICSTSSKTCSICNRTFVDKTRLKIHLRLHSGEKPFQCETCKKSFSQKRTLQEHLWTHEQSRPFRCTICSKNFAQNNHLKYHLAAIHCQKSNVSCQVCDKSFPFLYQLRKHQKVHDVIKDSK